MKNVILILSMVFSFISCSKNDTDDKIISQNITPILIAEGNLFSEFTNKSSTTANLVINNETDWNSFILDMDNPNNLSLSFSETNIDFNNFTILAIFDQPRPTGGYQITVTNIIKNINNITVNINYLGNGDATQMPTHPYYVVKIPKTTKPIIFK